MRSRDYDRFYRLVLGYAMLIEAIKTKDKSAALAVLNRHLDSPDQLCADFQYLDGEYEVEIWKSVETMQATKPPARPVSAPSLRCP